MALFTDIGEKTRCSAAWRTVSPTVGALGDNGHCRYQSAWCATGWLLKQDKGDRAFVERLLMARTLGDTGLDTLEVACDLTLQTGVIAAAMVLNEMRRLTEAERPKILKDIKLSTPTLQLEPIADGSRYDSLRRLPHEH